MSVNTPKACTRISPAALFLKGFIPSCHIDSAMNIRGEHSQEGNLTETSLHMLQAHLTHDQFLSPIPKWQPDTRRSHRMIALVERRITGTFVLLLDIGAALSLMGSWGLGTLCLFM